MNRFPNWRPSPAIVVAALVLFVALGGSGYAATHLSHSPGTTVKKKKPRHADAAQDLALIKKQASKLRGPKGAKGDTGADGASGVQAVWSAQYPATSALLHPAASGAVAHLTFTAATAGFVLATADFEIRARNHYDTTLVDCRVQSQLAPAASAPAGAGPGFVDEWLNGNLPTQNGAGTYLSFSQSISRVLPVVAGANTVYLNGSYDCTDALWGPITITAALASSNPAASITVG